MYRCAMNASFAQEVPEELIIYELADRSAKAYTPAAEALREFRRRRREARHLAVECQESHDLPYLFDDEEIQEERARLIREEEEYPYHWWVDQQLDDDVEHYEQLKREAAEAGRAEERPDFEYEDLLARDDQEEVEEHQLWAELDGDWRGARYVDGLGFVSDEYDSGHDEPNEIHEPYPPVKSERFVDLDAKERRMQNCLDQVRRRAQRRACEETRELCKQWRRLALLAMRSDPDCSFD